MKLRGVGSPEEKSRRGNVCVGTVSQGHGRRPRLLWSLWSRRGPAAIFVTAQKQEDVRKLQCGVC